MLAQSIRRCTSPARVAASAVHSVPEATRQAVVVILEIQPESGFWKGWYRLLLWREANQNSHQVAALIGAATAAGISFQDGVDHAGVRLKFGAPVAGWHRVGQHLAYRVPVQSEHPGGSRPLIPSARQARRTRAYISTGYIHLTLDGLLINLIDDGGRYSFPERRQPQCRRSSRPRGPLYRHPLHPVPDKLRAVVVDRPPDIRYPALLITTASGGRIDAVAQHPRIRLPRLG